MRDLCQPSLFSYPRDIAFMYRKTLSVGADAVYERTQWHLELLVIDESRRELPPLGIVPLAKCCVSWRRKSRTRAIASNCQIDVLCSDSI